MDKYVKIKKIGEGSFGKALLVRNKEIGKQMVVKEINMSRMQRKEREEARKEVAVLAQLAHPNVVAYRESFEELGNLYIVMDYCDGGDLYGKINAQRGILFTEDQILDWFVQTCLAIKHIHDRKILHRDIKSQNIFLTRHGFIKLGDFGIAKVLNSTVELARTCIGTPYYLSPEICENKPYNNKSDVWSLGCVLYELCTLKHAFEAGNMKNLVLKIIRGSYPPPPPRYSYEIRNLIASLFKRNPRERPSINTVLRKSLLQSRIKRFLSESELADEFSHTVMHGVKIKKNIPPGGPTPRPLPPAPVVAKKPPSQASTPPRYNPASVYAPSAAVARRSKEGNRQSSESVRKSGGGAKRPPSGGKVVPSPAAVYNQDLARRKQELIDKERRRREEAKKKEQQYAKAHKDLIEKQRAERINRAREEGWKSVLSDTMSSEEGDKNSKSSQKYKNKLGARREDPNRYVPSPKPAIGGPAVKDRGNYEKYHAFLNKMDAERKAADNAPVVRPAGGVAAALQAAGFNPAQAARDGHRAGALGGQAADKARVNEEFFLRKREAALNKARAHGNLHAPVGVAGAISPRPVSRPSPSPSPSPSVVSNPNSARSERDAQEQEYLAKLRQIRLQNFNERRMIKEKVHDKGDPKYKPPVDPKHDPDLRKKKIEALRAQADERAKKLKEELEKKRKEAYELEQKKLKEKLVGKPVKSPEKPSKPQIKPAPVIPMTEAMKAIGVVKEAPKPEPCPIGMTAAMAAIGAVSGGSGDAKSTSAEDQPAQSSPAAKTQLQKKKEEILKRLNSKPPFAPGAENTPAERPKWGEPVKPLVASEADRPKWGPAGDVGVLAQISLEETSSLMEATSAEDVVLKYNKDSVSVESARKQWGGPRGTVLNALQQAQLSPGSTISDSDQTGIAVTPPPVKGGTITISKEKKPAAEEPSKEPVKTEGLAPNIGSTFTVAHNAAKGTVVIKRADQPPTAVSIIAEEEADTMKEESKTDGQEEGNEGTPEGQNLEPPSSLKDKTDGSPRSRQRKSKSRSRSPSPKIAFSQDDVSELKDQSPLFNKVELEDDEETIKVKAEGQEDMALEDLEEEVEVKVKDDTKEETSPPKNNRLGESSGGLVLGLTTGNFDIDVKMLRTCSEPDLSKLFKTAASPNPFMSDLVSSGKNDVAASVNVVCGEELLEIDDEEEDVEYGLEDLSKALEAQLADEGNDTAEEEEEEKEVDEKKDNSEEKGLIKGEELVEDGEEKKEDDLEVEEEAEAGGDTEDELETLRESMMSILENDDGEEALSPLATKKKKKGTKKTKKAKKKKCKDSEDGEDSQSSLKRQWSQGSVEDFRTMRETMKSLLMPESGLKPVKEVGAGDAAKGKDAPDTGLPNIVPGRESWQDDDDDVVDDDYFEEEDMFSRLEESRVKLEEELGCDTFLQAYKTVQAIHEDEDENMEEGVEHVTKIIGHSKMHLYPTILQLVMADGVFTEDND